MSYPKSRVFNKLFEKMYEIIDEEPPEKFVSGDAVNWREVEKYIEYWLERVDNYTRG